MCMDLIVFYSLYIQLLFFQIEQYFQLLYPDKFLSFSNNSPALRCCLIDSHPYMVYEDQKTLS